MPRYPDKTPPIEHDPWRWTPTSRLRWCWRSGDEDGEPALQQLWVHTTKMTEWRDVPGHTEPLPAPPAAEE